MLSRALADLAHFCYRYLKVLFPQQFSATSFRNRLPRRQKTGRGNRSIVGTLFYEDCIEEVRKLLARNTRWQIGLTITMIIAVLGTVARLGGLFRRIDIADRAFPRRGRRIQKQCFMPADRSRTPSPHSHGSPSCTGRAVRRGRCRRVQRCRCGPFHPQR